MPKTPRFWGYFTLIAFAHVLAMIALIRWSHAQNFVETQNVVWMNGGGTGDGDNTADVQKAAAPTPAPAQLRNEESEEDRPILTSAKSEIELTRATPKPASSPTATPREKATPKPTPKATPKPKKKVLVKAPEKERGRLARQDKSKADIDPEEKRTAKKNEDVDEKPKKLVAARGAAGKGISAGADGKAGGAGATSQFGWYGNMLHDRFHSAWIQPTTVAQSGEKISVLVKVRIEQDGSVSQFQLVKPSGNIVVDQSVSAVAQRITQVDPLPSGLGTAGHYDVRINFELKPE
jgi:TonB family protein